MLKPFIEELRRQVEKAVAGRTGMDGHQVYRMMSDAISDSLIALADGHKMVPSRDATSCSPMTGYTDQRSEPFQSRF